MLMSRMPLIYNLGNNYPNAHFVPSCSEVLTILRKYLQECGAECVDFIMSSCLIEAGNRIGGTDQIICSVDTLVATESCRENCLV